MENILKIDKIEKYYGNKSSLTKAIDNLSFDVEKGEFVAIMGASYSSRVIFIKDGKIFNEIIKGTNSRKEFFDKIIDVVTLLGGDLNDAL